MTISIMGRLVSSTIIAAWVREPELYFFVDFVVELFFFALVFDAATT